MSCPNCTKEMIYLHVDEQRLWHCTNCGGSFFEENGINRISLNTAQTLSQDKKIDEISTYDKLCPKDQHILIPIQTDSTDSTEKPFPSNVLLLSCPTCNGIFTYPDDLLNFKKAIGAKIDYFKLWNIPLPSVRSIALLSVIIFISAMSFTTFVYWQQQNISNIQAQDLIRNLYITTSGRYLLISFKTAALVRSKIIFTDITTNLKIEKIVSSEPKDYHQLTTSDVNLEDEIYYQIILTDEKGRETKTDVRKLEIH